MPTTAADIDDCIRVLEALAEDRAKLADLELEKRVHLLTLAGKVAHPGRDEQRLLRRAVKRKRKQKERSEDEQQLARTGIRRLREQSVYITPGPLALEAARGGSSQAPPTEAANGAPPQDEPPLNAPRSCYVCKTICPRPHFFYDQMCGPCGDFNYKKRSQTADLRGRTALVSGGRVKIGYQAVILLLRAGARVIVSTRFPRDAAERYAREADFETFRDRLAIYGLDLRHTPSVEAFARHLNETEPRLDFVLHNACQTVRRPSGFYQHLMDGELAPISTLPSATRSLLADYDALRDSATRRLGTGAAAVDAEFAVGLHAAPILSQVALTAADHEAGPLLFPSGQLDADLQQVDLRDINSWRLPLDQVSTVELLEVQLVNAIAPFVLNAKLKALMLKERTFDKHIVNVSAMEGQFYRRYKTDKHPHTNMAKAALNMMTRTSAPDYAKDGIYMNSVDTGWVTDEDPAHLAQRKTAETGFQPPLDIVDGAARIVDPIFNGINTGEHVWGQFLKDYGSTAW